MIEQLSDEARKFALALAARRNSGSPLYASDHNPSREQIQTLVHSGALRTDGSRLVVDEDVAQVMGLPEFDYS